MKNEDATSGRFRCTIESSPQLFWENAHEGKRISFVKFYDL